MESNKSKALSALNKAYSRVIHEMDLVVEWYYINRKSKGKKARALRFSAVLMLVFSGLVPLITSVSKSIPREWLYAGYLLAAVGAGLVLIDKYYGFTSSWIRFVLTGNEIKRFKEVFEIKWQTKIFEVDERDYDTIKIMYNELLIAKTGFDSLVKEETKKWADEFLQSSKELESSLNARISEFQSRIESNTNTVKTATENSVDKTDLLIDNYINQNYKILLKRYNVDAVYRGRKIRDGVVISKQAIVFVPSQKIQSGSIGSKELIPEEIEIVLPKEPPFKVQTDVLNGGGPLLLATSLSSCDLQATKVIGCSISRLGSPSSGTLGFKCYRDRQPYFVSCYHVVCAPELNSGSYEYSNTDSDIVVSPSSSDSNNCIQLGHVERGLFGPTIDAAIVRMDSDDLVLNKVCELQWRISDYQVLTKMHEEIGYVVRMFGRTSKLIEGTIVSRKASAIINIEIGDSIVQHYFEDIILTSIVPQPGDSGALVFDYNMKAIGLMCAYSTNYSIIIPIEKILQTFDLSFQNS